MASRFFSGSLIPASAAKNSLRASTTSTATPRPRTRHHPPGVLLAHQAVLDEDGPQLLAERPVAEHGDGRGVDPARQRVDRLALADGASDVLHLRGDEALGVERLRDLLDHVLPPWFSFCNRRP